MSRPKGSLNRPKAPTANGDVDTDHNKKPKADKPPKAAPEALNDDQLQVLFHKHKRDYEKALAAKKDAAAKFLNVCKLAKSESVSIKDIKLAIDLESEGGEERMREDIQRRHRVARWAGLPVGTQPSFFDEEDRTPSVDRARAEGHRSGLKGESANAPSHFGMLQQQAWLTGWGEGQKVLTDRIKETHNDQRAEDAAEFDGGEEAPAT
jgi:ribosome modulation factor